LCARSALLCATGRAAPRGRHLAQGGELRRLRRDRAQRAQSLQAIGAAHRRLTRRRGGKAGHLLAPPAINFLPLVLYAREMHWERGGERVWFR